MFKEFDAVTLKSSVEGSVVQPGSVGVVVHIHSAPRLAYLVEFCNEEGETLDLVSLLPGQIESFRSLKQAA
jgi:hypothetical protein